MMPIGKNLGRGFRWTVCSLVFAATTINYMDRQVLGILAPTLQKSLGWNELEYSHIVIAFQTAYALGLLGFGRLIDAIGTRHGYGLSVLAWSIAATAHALANSVFGFGLARFALGFGEAGNFPAAVKTVSEWFPPRERAFATGIFNSGSNVGAIVAPLLVPWLTLRFGWRASFVVLGLSGFVWLFFWYRLYDQPGKSTRISEEELRHIRDGRNEVPGARIPWLILLGRRQTWAFITGISFTVPIWWFFLYWLPKFLQQTYGLDMVALGPPLIVVYSMTCFGSIGAGWLSGFLILRGWSLNAGRKTVLLLCALCVVPVFFAAKAHGLWTATLLVGLAASAHQGWAANLFTLVSDLFPKRAVATVVGIGSMFGACASIAFAWFTGVILQQTGSYWILFVIAAGSYLVALAVIQALIPDMKPAVFAEEPLSKSTITPNLR